jgi:hypothetical protein
VTDDRMHNQDEQSTTTRAAYVTPSIERFGTFAELTKGGYMVCEA